MHQQTGAHMPLAPHASAQADMTHGSLTGTLGNPHREATDVSPMVIKIDRLAPQTFDQACNSAVRPTLRSCAKMHPAHLS